MKHLLAAVLAILPAACASDPYCRFAPGAGDLCSPIESERVRLVCVGENHDARAHHEFQLWTLDAMSRSEAPLLLGMEMFQRAFQAPLDDYVAGRIDEREMLRRTEYFTRWSYNFTNYAPLWRYAREHGIRVVALNADGAIVRKVQRGTGLSGLTDEERGMLAADIDLADAAHRARIEDQFRQVGHPLTAPWYESMTAWDETMAETAAHALDEAGPASRMLVVAGNGHCETTGIPDRVARRIPGIARVVILPESKETPAIGIGRRGEAFVVTFPAEEAPPSPKFGVAFEPAPEGGLLVKTVQDGGAAALAGIVAGDVIVSVEEASVGDMTDLRCIIDTHGVGDVVAVGVRRGGETLSISLTLAPAPPPAPAPKP